MSDVFVSYKAEDRARVRPLVEALEADGFSVWWDAHIGAGAEWRETIAENLDRARCVIVVWSKRSTGPEGHFVRDEASRALRRGTYLPVRIDKVDPPLGFGERHALPLKGWKGERSDPRYVAVLNGVRLMLGLDPAVPSGGRRPVGRRAAVGAGLAVAALAAGGGLVYRRSRRSDVPKEVEPLLLQAKQLMNQNTREGQYQAIGLYRRIVQIAPDYADGWGWLGYAHGVISHYRDRPEALEHKARAEAAGRRALELDPNSAFGEVALAVALPFIGHWAERERRLLRALELRPDEDEVLILLGVALQFAGRSSEAVPFYQRVKRKPFTPAEYNNFIRALWSAGRLAELDQAIQDAASLYPTQATIWFTRLSIAGYGGRVSEVAALTGDAQSRPGGITETDIQELLSLTQAIQSRDRGQADAVIATERANAATYAGRAEYSIRNASALGRLDEAFEFAHAYYFGRGFIIPDSAAEGSSFSPEQRQTRLLFEPVTKPMRADPRFEDLVNELGFDRYWRQTGKPPDYRHVRGL